MAESLIQNILWKVQLSVERKWKWNLLSCVWLFVYGILQARILERVAFPFPRGSSQPRNWTRVSCIADRFFTNWVSREAHCQLKQFLSVNIKAMSSASEKNLSDLNTETHPSSSSERESNSHDIHCKRMDQNLCLLPSFLFWKLYIYNINMCLC